MTAAIWLAAGLMVEAALFAAVTVTYFGFKRLRTFTETLRYLIDAANRLSKSFENSEESTKTMVALVAVLRRMVSSAEAQTAAIREFTGLVLKDEHEPPFMPPPTSQNPTRPPWFPGGPPPPPNPAFEQYAKSADAGFLSQDEQQMAEQERQEELREQGIETDPARISMPTPEQIKLINT